MKQESRAAARKPRRRDAARLIVFFSVEVRQQRSLQVQVVAKLRKPRFSSELQTCWRKCRKTQFKLTQNQNSKSFKVTCLE